MSVPTLVVWHPDTYLPERYYVMDTLLHEFLGLEYEAHAAPQRNTSITVSGDSQRKCLTLEDVLFQVPDDEWLSQRSLPVRPLLRWRVSDDLPEARVVSPDVPVIYGNPYPSQSFFNQTERKISLGLDIFGSAFFMLTRYEELVKRERDEHGRFPGSASLAFQNGFLERPIIDEYVEVVWSCMERLWPGLRRKKREYRLVLSCDVDQPLATLGKARLGVLRSLAGDLLRRRDVSLASRRIVSLIGDRFGWHDPDPFNTFDFIMSVSESVGVASTFYFICEHAGKQPSGSGYSIDMPWIRKLMRRIHNRRHTIGLHGSYDSYNNQSRVQYEFERLLRATQDEGIKQELWGSRQHFLRWETPLTWRILNQAGIDYDSTLSYADHVGFRCGVCREFPVYDLERRERLRLRERPLIVMERTLIGARYMSMSVEEACDVISALARRVMAVDGDFTFLCHNDTIASKSARRIYAETVRACASSSL